MSLSVIDGGDNMTPVIFINCKDHPFVEQILCGKKLYETRTRNTLGKLVGQKVFLAETGKRNRPLVIGTAVLGAPEKITREAVWKRFYRDESCIPAGSRYDWKPGTRVKYAYPVIHASYCIPFIPHEGIRHGRVWMEYERKV